MKHLANLGAAFIDLAIFVGYFATMGASVVFGGLIALAAFGSFL